jgi:hypothetical protein
MSQFKLLRQLRNSNAPLRYLDFAVNPFASQFDGTHGHPLSAGAARLFELPQSLWKQAAADIFQLSPDNYGLCGLGFREARLYHTEKL